MDTAGKNKTKLTLLSIYEDCLGGFTGQGKTSFARGGTINDRFRFSKDVRSARASGRRKSHRREEREEGGREQCGEQPDCFSQMNPSYHIRRK